VIASKQGASCESEKEKGKQRSDDDSRHAERNLGKKKTDEMWFLGSVDGYDR
jgi:hypothetical protein